MTDDDLKQIRGVVKEEVNVALEPVVKKLDALWDQTIKLTGDLTEVQEKQDSHTVALKKIVTNTEADKENIVKLDKRAHELENQAGIVPPPELTIL